MEINERVAMIPINDIDIQERVKQLYVAIEGLNKIDKAIMLLYLEEIAEIMGISESNVGFKINRIKKILRDKLKIEQL